jgi:hypothetical protein
MSRHGKAERRLSVRQKKRLRHGHGGAPRLRWLGLLAVVAIGACIAALAAFLAPRPGSSEAPGPPKAIIVDQLSLTSPNSAFVQEATSMLEGAGYAVDYYGGDQVTIDFYRDLARHHYGMVILRVHAARFQTNDGTLTDDVVLFTGEAYDRQKYVQDRLAGYLARARYFLTNPVSYFFGVTAKFVESKMKGDFEGATVILMGCDGLRSNTMAEAFVGRGAKAFISWDDLVSTDHTDAATETLLRHLLLEKQTSSDAVAQTMTEVGPDPSYGSKLLVYPEAAAASTVP